MPFSVSDLANKIEEVIRAAQQERVSCEPVFSQSPAPTGKNEFLFFIKPEITLADDSIQLSQLLEVILSSVQENGLDIINAQVLSAQYLEQHNIIAQHYGVINKLANDAVGAMSDGAKSKFASLYGSGVEEANVLGGFEVLKAYPDFNATTLEYLWQNVGSEKLAGGTYSIKVSFDGKEVFIVDGFHPRQLEHFTAKGRSIVVFTLVGDIDWEKARQEFIGATNPQKAHENSLRRNFLDHKSTYGLAEVSQGSNGVHLSAGPIEGLVELIRYNSNFETQDLKNYQDFAFGKQLAAHFSPEQVEDILNNVDVEVDGKKVSVFDLTEEKNSEESLELLKQFM
ncbi:MAG: hypothetical protein AAF694_15910 [Bacteroidota bacterium]